MNLTKGQKDALIRKASSIVDAKIAEKKKKLEAAWKPSKKLEVLLEKCKEIRKLRKAYLDALQSAGFLTDRYDIMLRDHPLHPGAYVCIHWNSTEDFYEEVLKAFRTADLDRQVNKLLEEYPNEIDIQDKLELACMDKTFDLDSFLAEYKNL